MKSVRIGFAGGTALALILTASSAAAQNSDLFRAPQPTTRGYSTPGSMPKPQATAIRPADDGMRFRGPLPAARDVATPLAPASHDSRAVRPASVNRPAPVPENARAQAPAQAPVQAQAPTAPARPEPAATHEQPQQAAKAPAVPASEQAARPVARSVAAAVVPAPNAASEAEVAAKIKEIVTSRQFDRVVARKPDREAIIMFYAKTRSFQPLWVAQGAPSARATDVLDYLQTIDADGLDPKDYPMPKLNVGSAEQQAQAEVKFTETLLTYARHAMNGRIHFSRVSPNIEYKLVFEPEDVLKKVAASDNMSRTLASLDPPQPAYKALKAKLAELRNAANDDDAAERIPGGPVLRYYRDKRGHETVMSDARVPQLRERLDLKPQNNTRYDAALAMAIGKFQKANGIQVTGQLNQPTIDALNPPSRARKIEAVLATMERWRWMPRDLGKTHVVLNIPDYYLRVYHDGEKVWQTKTVVGKPGHETPLLTETMKFITVNPTWNVPQSIIYKELLPVYETSDPQIFERQGLKMERNPDGSVRVYQPASERNALGQIRFNFPNKFLVYQHDTPEKNYFNADKRDYSHGCQRVENPLKYAEVLLSYASPQAGYTAESIKKLLGGEERQLDFRTQIPVHLTYQTAFVDENGKLQIRDDIYGLDKKMMDILRGPERQVADAVMERPADPNFQPTREEMAKLRSVAGGGSGPFGLFNQLFR